MAKVLRQEKYFLQDEIWGRPYTNTITLYERNLGIKDLLLAGSGASGRLYIEESDGYNKRQSYYSYPKRSNRCDYPINEANYNFEKICLLSFLDETRLKKGKTSEEVYKYFSDFQNYGRFEYFHPESRNFLYTCIYSSFHSRKFEEQASIIFNAIGKEIIFENLPQGLFNGLLWEIKNNSATLYRVIISELQYRKEQKENLSSFCGIVQKEPVYNHPNPMELFICVCWGPAEYLVEPNNLEH